MRLSTTKCLLLILLAAICFAGWSWWRPYEWKPDPGARFRITGTEVSLDHGYHWVTVRLKRSGKQPHDLTKQARLILADGRELEPADTRMTGDPDLGITGLEIRFWLEPGALTGPLKLRLNDGILTVKAGSAEPRLGIDGHDYYNSTRW
ncbi:MAG: hypothetical protein J0M04_08315 [Verrucomicrobia bacterium]|nr:hypothetical protein [Verrucomicrobiota bacterium]